MNLFFFCSHIYNNDIQDDFDFTQDASFYDFDSFLNFGNKFPSKDHDKQDVQTFHGKLSPDQSENVHLSKRRKIHHSVASTRRPTKPTTTSRRTTPRKVILPKVSMTSEEVKDSEWNQFESYLDLEHDQKSINAGWYPWNSGKTNTEVKTKHFVSSTRKPARKKMIDLSGMDKVMVKEICSTTRLSDVRSMCREYFVKKINKTKTKGRQDRKRFRKKITSTTTTEKPKYTGHLFFEPNSFRRRKSQLSIFDSLKSLILSPTTLLKQRHRSVNRRTSSEKGWLHDAVRNYNS